MSPDPTRTPEFLNHMLESISRILAYTSEMSGADFAGDSLVQDAVIRNIEIMGEAARNILNLDPNFARSHPELPLRDVYLMHNRVAHGYFNVDVAIVWNAVRSEIPELKEQNRKTLQAG